jgi:hypothetical protein
VQNVLPLPNNAEKRRYSLAMYYPCQLEHIIVIENPKCLRDRSTNARERNQFFRYSRDERKVFGRWSEHFRIEILTPTVAVKDYPAYRKHALAALASTELGYLVPFGTTVRTLKTGAPLMPAQPQPAAAEAIEPVESAPLPAQPAPCLAPGAPLPAAVEGEPSMAADPTARRTVLRPAIPLIDGNIEPSGYVKKRSRRSKSRSGVDFLQISRWGALPFAVLIKFAVSYAMHLPHH